jgi:hypothetical protein
MMAFGFFNGDTQNASPEAIKRRREFAARLLNTRAPRNIGEGFNAIGNNIAAAIDGARADRMEAAGNAEANRLLQPFFGSPTASAGNPVATGSATGSMATGNPGPGPAAFQEIGPRIKSDLMRDFQLAPEQAAGIVGNLAHESGGFGTLQEIKPMIPRSRGGFGYAQWTGPRRRQFESWAAENKLDPSSYEANYGFLKHELANTGEGRVLDRIRQTNDPAQATRIFSDVFLRPGIPGMGSREKWTQRALGFSQQPGNQAAPMPMATGGQPTAPMPMASLADMPAPDAAMAQAGPDTAPQPTAPGLGVLEATNEAETQFLENRMAAEQGQAAPVEAPPVNQGDVFSPIPMGGGFNAFVQRPPFGDAPSAAPAPAAAEAALQPRMVDAPMPPQRPADFAPQSPFVPQTMRQPMPEAPNMPQSDNDVAGAFARSGAMGNVFPIFGGQQQPQMAAQPQAQAPQMAAGGVSQAAPMNIDPGQNAPQQVNSRSQQLAAIMASPMVPPQMKQFAMQQYQQEQAQALARQEQARTQAQNDAAADALGIDRRLTGNQTILGAAAKAQLDRRSGQTRRSLQPVFATDAQGNTVMLQPGEDGTAVQTKMPEGVRIASGVDRIDAGTEFILIDKRTGNVVGRQPKDIAGAARQEVIGKDEGERITNAPGEVRVADQALTTLDQIRSHPGREGWGAQGSTASFPLINRGLPGTAGRDFVALVEQAQGQAFLQAFESLKGGGQITETEGKAATAAIARLDRSQSRAGFDQALKDIETMLKTARDRAARRVRVTPDGKEIPIGDGSAAPAAAGPRILSVEPVR